MDADRLEITWQQHAGRSRAVGVGLLVLTSILWSLSGAAVKVGHLPPLAFTFYRSLAAGLAMLFMVRLLPGRRPHALWMLLSAVTYTAVVAMLITAMTRDTAAAGILLQYTGPVFCALLAWIFQRRAMGRRSALAMVIAIVGVAIMLLGRPPVNWVGPVCGLISGFAFGALILILEKINRVAGGQANPAQVVLFNNLGVVVILLPFVLFTGSIRVAGWQLGLVAATGVIQLAFPYLLFQLALRRVQPVDASLLILLEPVLNPVWVALVTAERPDAATLIGGAAILVAMVIEATKPAREE